MSDRELWFMPVFPPELKCAHCGTEQATRPVGDYVIYPSWVCDSPQCMDAEIRRCIDARHEYMRKRVQEDFRR